MTRWVYDTPHPIEIPVAMAERPGRLPRLRDRPPPAHAHRRGARAAREGARGAGRSSPTTPAGVSALMREGFDLLHFAGHGTLDDGISPAAGAAARRVRRRRDDAAAGGTPMTTCATDRPDIGFADDDDVGPFVFLNACDLGRLPSGERSLGGFPEAFLRSGAGAFVGCSWAVGDDPAASFVRGLLRARCSTATSLGDATRTARAAAAESADLSDLAFAVYAHPRARLRIDLDRLTSPDLHCHHREDTIMTGIRPPSPAPDVRTAAPRGGGHAFTKAELAALRPHVITPRRRPSLLDGRRRSRPRSRSSRTTAADIEAIFTTHLPDFVDGPRPGPGPDRDLRPRRARRQAVRLRDRPAADRLVEGERRLPHPLRLADGVSAPRSGTRSGAGRPAAGAAGSTRRRTASSRSAARLLGGGGIWNDMKVDAAAASVDGGGGATFAAALGKWIAEHPDEVTVHAVGHSAGSIFHSHFIPAALEAGAASDRGVRDGEPPRPRGARRHVHRSCSSRARSGQIGRLAVFDMDDDTERDDNCAAHLQQVAPLPRLGLVRTAEVDADPRNGEAPHDGCRARAVLHESATPSRPRARTARDRRALDEHGDLARRLRRRRTDDGERREARLGQGIA